METTIFEIYYLTMRSIRELARIPLSLMFPILIPILQLLIFSQVFKNVSNLPGFASASYLDYQAPSVILMTVMFSAGNSAFSLILDMDTGFLDKLLLAPIARISILFSRLFSEAIRIFAQTILMTLVIVFLFGVSNQSGALGILMIALLNSFFGISYGGIFYTVALLTKNAQAAQAMFPITFPLLFLSTALMPKELLPNWLQTVASLNPVSYVIEAFREILAGQDTGQIPDAIALTLILGAVTLSSAFLAFRKLVD